MVGSGEKSKVKGGVVAPQQFPEVGTSALMAAVSLVESILIHASEELYYQGVIYSCFSVHS